MTRRAQGSPEEQSNAEVAFSLRSPTEILPIVGELSREIETLSRDSTLTKGVSNATPHRSVKRERERERESRS